MFSSRCRGGALGREGYSPRKPFNRRAAARIMSKRRVEELADPEKFEQRKEYNKSYYLKNKEQILKRRAEVYAAKVASRRK
ncbi:hypothetical protein N9255_00515 [bacterium]|nr:hypothetical protein [bacterium]